MKLIVAVDKNWGIGKDGSLLASIPEDMKFFRTTTANSTVIMGRKTLESFPNSKPLKNRINIVITKSENYSVDGAIVVHSVEDAIKASNEYDREVFVIGGESIYRQMLRYCDTAYITKIDNSFSADTFFPNLDEDTEWKCVSEGEEKEHEGLKFRFLTYEKA